MNEPIDGMDATITIKLTKAQAMNGCTYRLHITDDGITCPECKGKGKIHFKKCKTCNGLGVVRLTRTIDVKIPKRPNGMQTGDKLTVYGAGPHGENGGKNGNLIGMIEVEE